jgi:hypothetical protein
MYQVGQLRYPGVDGETLNACLSSGDSWVRVGHVLVIMKD